MHNKIIAVDFDGVLCCSKYPEAKHQNWLNKFVLKYIKNQQQKGAMIVLWTCRTDDGDELGTLSIALQFLKEKGLIPDLVNKNPPVLIRLFGSSSRKVSADRYIDDKNVGLIGWLLRFTHKRSIKKIYD